MEVTPKTDDRVMLDLDQLTTHIRLSVSKLFRSFKRVGVAGCECIQREHPHPPTLNNHLPFPTEGTVEFPPLKKICSR